MTADLIGRLRHAVGPSGLIGDPDEMAGYLTDWRNAYAGAAAAVVRPGNAEEVAAVVAVCREAGVAVVPQGGQHGAVRRRRSGLLRPSGSALPDAHAPHPRPRRRQSDHHGGGGLEVENLQMM